MKLKKKFIMACFIIVLAIMCGFISNNSYAATLTVSQENTPDNYYFPLRRTINSIVSSTRFYDVSFDYTITPITSPTNASQSLSDLGPWANPITLVGNALEVNLNDLSSGIKPYTTMYSRISLVGVKFNGPGVYEYTIAETATTDSALPLDGRIYSLIVTVGCKVDDNNNPTNELVILSSTIIEDKSQASEKKEYLFFESNQVKNAILRITSTMKGNSSEPDKYVRYALKIDVPAYTVYSITGQDTQVTYNGATFNSVTSISGTSGGKKVEDYTTPVYIYLKQGQTAVIGYTGPQNTDGAIPVYSNYDFRIDSADSITGYATKINNETRTFLTTYISTYTSVFCDINVELTKTVAASTGVIIEYIPYAIIAVVGILGLIVIVKVSTKKNKRK